MVKNYFKTVVATLRKKKATTANRTGTMSRARVVYLLGMSTLHAKIM